jgi:hypothetical protein
VAAAQLRPQQHRTSILPTGVQAALKPVASLIRKPWGHPGRHVGVPFVSGGKIVMVHDPLTAR